MSQHWSDDLRRLGACGDAVEWARTRPSYDVAWRTCRRGDWMLWLASECAGDHQWDSPARRAIALAAARCARLALPIWEACYPEDRRVLETLDLIERYGRGESVTREALVAAANAAAYADAAAYAGAKAAADADAKAAYAGAKAAADACCAAAAAAYAYAAYADSAYYAAAYAADAAYGAARRARATTLARCAGIVRGVVERPSLTRLPAERPE